MPDIEKAIRDYQRENGLDFALSYTMPEGYETAFGTFDIELNTLFFNRALLSGADEAEAAYTLYHELRHALQYHRPDLFSEEIRESLPYVILYNGVCFRLRDGRYTECRPGIPEEEALAAYLSLPYEADANRAAADAVRALYPDRAADAEALLQSSLPGKPVPMEELRRLFRLIDNAIDQNR